MFETWLWGLRKDLKSLAWLGAAATTCWSLWLRTNDLFLKRNEILPLCRLHTRLCTGLVPGPSYKSQYHKIWLQRGFNIWHVWLRSFLSRHMGDILVYKLSIISVSEPYKTL